MPLISSSIPNFVNGVSQQPFTLRLSSQLELQENGLSTVAQGLKKRPPTQHLKKITSSPLSNCFIHTINRDLSERYVAFMTDGDLKVYDIAGNEKTVNFPDGKSYLSAAEPSSSFAAVTVADYTFVVNKTKIIAADTTLTPSRPYEALVNVKVGNYGKTYQIIINGSVVASYTTPSGTGSSDAYYISTDSIAANLYSSLVGYTETITNLTYSSGNSYTLPSGYTQANTIRVEMQQPASGGALGAWTTKSITWTGTNTFTVDSPATPVTYSSGGLGGGTITSNPTIRIIRSGGTTPYTVTRSGSVIYIGHTADFTIRTEDGFNSAGMVAIKDKLQKFSDLPANPNSDGFVVEITGSGDSSTEKFNSYYVKFNTNYGGAGTGVWQECPASEVSLGLDATNMPYILVRESDGTFTFKKATWKHRVAGDMNSNPNPSFVNHKISDVFFYRNRLGFLSDEAVIFSEAGQYFNFLRTTVTDLLDADPIDVNASHTKVSLLKHAVPFNKQLLLFSEQTQFIIEQNELLTPKTIGIKVATEFPCNINAKPVGVGKNVYFSVDKGNWSAFREYFADLNNITFDSMDITGHLPNYIPTGVTKIAAAANEDILVALSAGDPSSLYVYKYFWSNNEKLQSSWSKWTLGSDVTILNVDFIGSELYLVVNRSDGVYFEKINVSLGDIGVNEPYLVHLDRKIQLTSSNVDYSAGYTTISLSALGYNPTSGNYKLVVKTHPTLKAGEIYDVIWNGSTARVLGDVTGGTYSFGRTYMMQFRLSTVTIKQAQAGGGQKSDTEGRLQMRKIAFNYANTGLFDIYVTPEGREPYLYVFSGKVLGNASSTIGAYSVQSGRFVVPIISRNIGLNVTIKNDSPLPSNFLSADWEAYFVKRSQAV